MLVHLAALHAHPALSNSEATIALIIKGPSPPRPNMTDNTQVRQQIGGNGPVHTSTPSHIWSKTQPGRPVLFTHKSKWATYAKPTLSGTGKPPRKMLPETYLGLQTSLHSQPLDSLAPADSLLVSPEVNSHLSPFRRDSRVPRLPTPCRL